MVDFSTFPSAGDYPQPQTGQEQFSGMSPRMEAKYLWLMDQAAKFGAQQYGGADPLAAQQVAPFDPQQQQAFQAAGEGIGSYQPYLDQAKQYGQQMVGGTFDPQSYQQYLNPYQEYVTQGISEQYDKAINQANAQATGAGAFGGARQGIMQSELAGGKAQAIGQSLAQGYGQSMGLARGDFENQMSRYGAGAQMMSGLGQQAQQAGAMDVASLMGAGSVQQQRGQQEIDAQYKADLANRYDPYQRMGFMTDIFRGTPAGQMSTTMGTSPMTNPLSQALGAGVFGAGVAQGWT